MISHIISHYIPHIHYPILYPIIFPIFIIPYYIPLLYSIIVSHINHYSPVINHHQPVINHRDRRRWATAIGHALDGMRARIQGEIGESFRPFFSDVEMEQGIGRNWD